MADGVKLPRNLSEEPGGPARLRPSHERIIEELDRWANSRGLQPPILQPLQPPTTTPPTGGQDRSPVRTAPRLLHQWFEGAAAPASRPAKGT
jgi:hypothetical protein